jgi:hypothetical protein
MKATEGTLKTIDRGAKTLTVKTAGGAEETYHIAIARFATPPKAAKGRRSGQSDRLLHGRRRQESRPLL